MKKIAKCNRANMSDAEIIQWVVRGLGNDRYRDYLGPLIKYQRPTELLLHLIAASEYIRDKNEYPNTKSDKNLIKHVNSKNNSHLSNNRITTKSTVICFRCRDTRHLSKNCTKKLTIVCYRCSKLGHKANECHSKLNGHGNGTASDKENPQSQAVLQFGTSVVQNKYFKDAIINDVCVRAYVDMGTSCIAIKKSEVDRLKIKYDGNIHDEFIGYGFGRVKALGRFEINISIDGVSACVLINVVPDDVQEIALLVGHPFTEQPHIMITSIAGKLKVEEIIPISAENQITKTPMWTNDAVVVIG